MFHEGDVQSGIALATQESKSVICFVRDDAEESSTWEEEYLVDEEVSNLLKEKAVALKLNAGSQEAGFLSSFCPIGDVPTLVVVKAGKLREYITIGVSKEEFKARLKASFEDDGTATAPQARQEGHAAAEPIRSTPSQGTATPNPQAGSNEQTEAQRRASIREGKRPAREEKEPETNPKPKQGDWKKQQRKIEQHQKDERQRVLDQIKQDRIERKQRDEQRKASSSSMRPPSPSPQPLTPTKPRQIRLQVRLFDGTSIRSTFSHSQTIRDNIRPWIGEQRSDGSSPYTLKQILAPHPNHAITTAEESSTLEDLNLGSTANLIIVPVKTYSDAYPNSSMSSLTRGLHAGYGFLFNIIAAIVGIITTFLGIRQTPPTESGAVPPGTQPTREPQRTESSASGSVRSTSSGLNIRTLRDQKDEHRDEQFYNGNQTNFQPRRDSDDSE